MSGAAKRTDQGGRRGGRGVVRAVAVRYPVGSFVVLAFVVSWAAWGRCWRIGRAGSSGRRRPTCTCSGAWPAGGCGRHHRSVVFYGFGEEVGWRGYLQPTLEQRRPVLGAAAILSVIWALWHLPLFGITAGYRQMPAVGFIGFYFSLLVAALVFAWLWHRSGYSLLVVAVFHAVFDIATTTPPTPPSSRS